MAVPIDPVTLQDIGKLLVPYVIALPTGWYNEREAHHVGVRTFPLVAMASCGYVLLARPAGAPDIEAQSRIIQGLVAGIGLVGGGAILKAEGNVQGTAAAASTSIWNMGVIGAAVAEERWALAVALGLRNLFALRVFLPIKRKLATRGRQEDDSDGES